MPTMTLTAQFVREAACGAGRRKTDFFDFGQRGFLLEVRQSGGKTYYQRYTDERGRERQYKIGPADVLTLDQARRKAKQIVAEALLGADPQQKRREMRGIPLLKDFVAERYLPYVRGYKNSWVTDETVLRIHVLPKLGNLALDELKTEAISTVVNAMREDGYASGTMNRVVAPFGSPMLSRLIAGALAVTVVRPAEARVGTLVVAAIRCSRSEAKPKRFTARPNLAVIASVTSYLKSTFRL